MIHVTVLRPNRSESPRRDRKDLEGERRALRRLIDQFADQPEAEDDNGFCRNVGRYIARTMLKPRWPGDTGY